MAEDELVSKYNLAEDDKAVQLMVYVSYGIFWGTVVTKNRVRLSTWLRGQAAPDNIRLMDSKSIITTAGGQPITTNFTETIIPVGMVNAYHILPPVQEPMDFDPSEPNRKFIPAVLTMGTFLCKCKVRISTLQTLDGFIEVTHEDFTTVYDAVISCPVMPSLGNLNIPLMQVRKNGTVFSLSLE